jgi:ABC-type nitrate/sulfonate/bicarbonate transport system substrate-binding protein
MARAWFGRPVRMPPHGLVGLTLYCLVSLTFVALVLPATAGTDTLRIGKAGRTAFSFVPTDVGMQTGIFKNNGLDLDVASFGGDAKVQQAMAADSLDIGLGSGPGLAFIVKGSPVKGVAAMAGPPLIFALVVRNDGSVNSVDDLKGRTIGISTVGSITSWIADEVARQKGWGHDGITQVPIGDDGSRVAAVKSRSLDAAIVNLAVALNYADRGDGRIILRFGDLVKHFHTHVIFATDKVIAERPDQVRRFLKGWFETVALMHSDKDATVKIAMPVMDTDARLTGEIYDELMPMFSDDGHFDPEALAVLQRSFVETNTLPREPDMSKLVTETFLPGR